MFKFKKKIENIDDIAYKCYISDIKLSFGNDTVYLCFNSFLIDSVLEENYEKYYEKYYIKAISIIRKRKIIKLNEIY